MDEMNGRGIQVHNSSSSGGKTTNGHQLFKFSQIDPE